MLRPQCYITIGDYEFNKCRSVNIVRSFDQFTDTASIVLPSKFRDVNRNMVNGDGAFKKGDLVTIQLGYYPNLTTVFEGYVNKIIPKSPMTIECEDKSWKLKQLNIPNFYQTACTVTQLVTHLIGTSGIEFETVDANIGTFRISNKDYVNVVDCLGELKSNLGLYSWFRDGVLNVGYPTTQDFYEVNTVDFGFQRNIIGDGLEYNIVTQTDVVLQGISNKLDNTKITRYAFYDNEGTIILSDTAGQGEQRTFNYIDISQSDLDDRLEKQLPQMISSGYRGTFQTFGEPIVFPLDRVRLTDNKYPEREGTYLVKKVEISFGVDGYRQNVELDTKLSGN